MRLIHRRPGESEASHAARVLRRLIANRVDLREIAARAYKDPATVEAAEIQMMAAFEVAV